jgi:hypothetical protein
MKVVVMVRQNECRMGVSGFEGGREKGLWDQREKKQCQEPYATPPLSSTSVDDHLAPMQHNNTVGPNDHATSHPCSFHTTLVSS